MKVLPPWVLRRVWLLIVTVGVVVAVGVGLSGANASVYQGEATFLVPSGASEKGPGSAFEAKSLAVTYVSLIPKDEAVLRYVAGVAKLSIAEVRGSLAVSTISDTSLIRLQFVGPSTDVTRAAVNAFVLSLTGKIPTSQGIPAGTLILTNSEVDTIGTQPQSRSLPLLVLLGIGLGAVLLAAMERVDARVDEAGQLIGFTDASIVDLQQISPSVARSLFHRRLETMGPSERVVLSPIHRRHRAAAGWVLRQLRDGAKADELEELEKVTLGPSPIPGDPDMIQLAQSPVALVIPAGIKATKVRETFETLAKAEASVRWIIFTPRSASRASKGVSASS